MIVTVNNRLHGSLRSGLIFVFVKQILIRAFTTSITFRLDRDVVDRVSRGTADCFFHCSLVSVYGLNVISPKKGTQLALTWLAARLGFLGEVPVKQLTLLQCEAHVL